MKINYRLRVPTIITIFCVCAILAKMEMDDTSGIFSLSFCAAFVWAPSLIKKIFRVNIPALFEYAGLFQMTFCLAFGSGLAFYYRVSNWDIIAHTFSGVLWSFGALWFLNILGQKLNTGMLLLFSFLFSTTTSVVWEIWEFLVDRVRDASDMQRAKYVSSGVAGVMDTMIDLVCNFVGCMIFIGIFIYDRKKRESALIEQFVAECNRVEKEENQEENDEIYSK